MDRLIDWLDAFAFGLALVFGGMAILGMSLKEYWSEFRAALAGNVKEGEADHVGGR